MNALFQKYPSIPWVAPFAVFMVLLAISPHLPFGQPWESIVRVAVIIAALIACSTSVLRDIRVRHWLASTALGVGVCAIWVAPDLLIPGYRSHWLFQNGLMGTLTTSIPADELANPLVVTLRVVRAVLLVPVLEELFWRGWLPRWIVDTDWQRVPLGAYNRLAFAATAALFAVEHGPFWEVGLVCGIIYNWWMWRTKSLGDLILVHAVTNGCLALVVLVTKRYEFWM